MVALHGSMRMRCVARKSREGPRKRIGHRKRAAKDRTKEQRGQNADPRCNHFAADAEARLWNPISFVRSFAALLRRDLPLFISDACAPGAGQVQHLVARGQWVRIAGCSISFRSAVHDAFMPRGRAVSRGEALWIRASSVVLYPNNGCTRLSRGCTILISCRKARR
jgi:hypothetical protein